HLDVAATLFHDTIRSRESQARPLPDLLRGEERLEDLSLGVLVHADAGIPNFEQNIVAGLHNVFLVWQGTLRGHYAVLGYERQRPAIRHRVPCVDGEIEKHLLDLTWIGANRPNVRCGFDSDFDCRLEQSLEHRKKLNEPIIQTDRRWAQHLRASERQQLTRERCRAIGCLLYFAEVVPVFLGKCWVAQDELGAASDHGEKIVEVMRD